MSDSRVPEFDQVVYVNGRNARQGKLRLAVQGVGWKNAETGDIVTVEAKSIKRMTWQRVCRAYQLRIYTEDGQSYKFENLPRDGFDVLRDTIKQNYRLTLEPKENSLRGWNWGRSEIHPMHMAFLAGNKPMFEIPFSEIANTHALKNEVRVQLAQHESSGKLAREDQLVECSFFVPGMAKSDEDGVDVDGQQEDGEEGGQTAAEALYEAIKSKADVDVDRSDVIVSFQDLPFQIPRGRYTVDMFSSFLRLRGKSYDYKLKYENVLKLFLLPKPDDLHVNFVLALDPPLRQGQTSYPFLVIQFLRDDELAVDLKLDEEAIASKYDNKLQRHYDAQSFEVVSSVFRGLTQKKITVPGSFRAANAKALAVKCSMKANEGLLYPLEKSLIFLYKPTIQILHSEIGSVTFSRIGGASGASRTIDLMFHMKTGSDHSFSNISREEHGPLNDYLQSKKIRVKSEVTEELPVTYAEYDDDDDDDAGGRGAQRSRADYDDEDEESPDEDFVDEDSDGDVGEEFASDYDSDPDAAQGKISDDEESSSRKRKQKDADGSKAKKKAGSGGDERKAKKAKSDGPKRASSAYIFFSNDIRDAVRQENPDLKITELSKIIGQRWKDLDQAAKQVQPKKYEDMAARDRERYNREVANGGGASSGSSEKSNRKPVKPSDRIDDSDEELAN
ncbi:FACT complex subunit [Sorochytrium milnesiophthora]